MVMITPFLWCCFLGVALGQNEEYGLPPEEKFVVVRPYSSDAPLPYPASHPRLSNDLKNTVSELLTFPQHQRQEENEEHLDGQPPGDESPPLPAEQYGLPPEGQSLQNSYSGGAQQQRDKSNNFNESPQRFQDKFAGVAIIPYPESQYKKYPHNPQSYAPYHQTNYDDGTQKYSIPQPQSSPEHQSTKLNKLQSYTENHGESKYPAPVAQNRVQEPSVPSSAPHQIYEVPEAYRNQGAQYTKYDSQTNENWKYRVPTDYQKPLDRYSNYEVPTNYRKSPVPVRYIAVFQKHRAPGKSDVATSSFLTQHLQNDDYRQAVQTGAERTGNPLVLPLSSNFRYSSPSGSISSTFISKDVGLTQGARQSLPRQDAEEGSDVSTQFNPQDTYGLPNF